MTRLIATLIAVASLITSTSLTADDGSYQYQVRHRTYPVQNTGPSHGHDHHVESPHWEHGGDHGDWDHDWEHQVHTPDLRRLDQYSDRLARIAKHLHQDAHKLSQDYEHSASIEGYVEQLEHLQEHMHRILHEVSRTGHRASSAVEHIKGDVTKTKALFNRLYGELKHQGFDGARTNDFYAMAHMREIIIRDAFPLVRLMESELYGTVSHAVTTPRYRVNRRVVRPAPTYRRGLPTFRINF